MITTRVDLVDKLTLVQPALAGNELIPALAHFWFTGDQVMAYNDTIAISVPCKTEFQGAIPRTLLVLLNKSRAKEVEMVPDGDNIKVKAASAKLTLPMLAPDNFLFEMPKPTKDRLPLKTGSFLSAIELCLKSVSKDTSVPDQIGITLIPDIFEDTEVGVVLYGLNNATLTRARLSWVGGGAMKRRIILPSLFCEQLLKLVKPDEPLNLEIHEDYALVKTQRNEVLFGRLVDVEKPVDFETIMRKNMPADIKKVLVPIPTKLQLIIERALIVTESAIDPGKTTISVREGRMKFVSKSGRGEVVDSMQIGEQHPEVSGMFSPKYLKTGYGLYDKMLVTESCVIMVGGSAVYLVAGLGV